jgi:hypothetical protein
VAVSSFSATAPAVAETRSAWSRPWSTSDMAGAHLRAIAAGALHGTLGHRAHHLADAVTVELAIAQRLERDLLDLLADVRALAHASAASRLEGCVGCFLPGGVVMECLSTVGETLYPSCEVARRGSRNEIATADEQEAGEHEDGAVVLGDGLRRPGSGEHEREQRDPHDAPHIAGHGEEREPMPLVSRAIVAIAAAFAGHSRSPGPRRPRRGTRSRASAPAPGARSASEPKPATARSEPRGASGARADELGRSSSQRGARHHARHECRS